MRKILWGMLLVAFLAAGNLVSGLLDGSGVGLPERIAPPEVATAKEGYLILAVSWTPSWCAAEGDARAAPRCAPGAGSGWLVHGLWPQHETGGWPEFCDTPHPAPRPELLEGMVDIMGAAGLAAHQWRKHGSCSGLEPAEYFARTRAAFAALDFPAALDPAQAGQGHTPEALRAAFRAANPAFGPDSLILTCRAGMAQELRVCLTHAGVPRACDAGVLARGCTARHLTLPPIR